jgi:hypothetical protein
MDKEITNLDELEQTQPMSRDDYFFSISDEFTKVDDELVSYLVDLNQQR